MNSIHYIHCHIVQFQNKNPYPPHGRSSEIPRGRGFFKVNILIAKYEAKLEFPKERRVQNCLLHCSVGI